MDIAKLYNVTSPAIGAAEISSPNFKANAEKSFGTFLDAAMNQINETNGYLVKQEEEEMKLSLGLTENAHDLTIAQAKAQTALQYTVALRDRFLEAYKEIIQIQI